MTQVSIIVATYNADPDKLRKTLEAAVAQRGVEVEIIITDDGSSRKDFDFLPAFFASHNFSRYQLLEHAVNRGTVYNCYDGVRAANGEYVFLTSPGDYLFDETTMQRFYEFARQRDCQICFGNAVRYAVADGKLVRTSLYGIPPSPEAYGPQSTVRGQKISFFGGNSIIGACYFRSRELTEKYLSQLLGVAVYMEDTPTTMMALLEGIRVDHLDSNIVFYEDGTGVSTGGNDKWNKLLRLDLSRSLEMLRAKYPNEPCLKILHNNISQTSQYKRIAYRFLRYPLISLSMLTERKLRKAKQVHCPPEDWERFASFLFRNTKNEVITNGD